MSRTGPDKRACPGRTGRPPLRRRTGGFTPGPGIMNRPRTRVEAREAAVRTAAVVVAALAVTGCGAGQETAVEAAARSFGEALRSGDAGRACAALAPRTREQLEADAGQPCARALSEQDLLPLESVGAVERYGRQASVTVHDRDGGSDTWFLSRFGSRWLVVAASCRPRAELPYDCDVAGP